MYKVSDICKLSGVSARTLHYYDEIGLLKPFKVSDNGYRYYDENSLNLLQQILFFKELDFPLNKIKEILNNPNFDRAHALNYQMKLLIAKRDRLSEIISTLDKTIKGDFKMNNSELFKGFSLDEVNYYKNQFKDEVKNKYEKTNAYKESKKTCLYDDTKWNEINNEANDIYKKLASLMNKTIDCNEVQSEIENWRNHISKNYYTCTLEIFDNLADMYIYDERFTNNIDKFKPGLAKFLSDGIKYYCHKNIINN